MESAVIWSAKPFRTSRFSKATFQRVTSILSVEVNAIVSSWSYM